MNFGFWLNLRGEGSGGGLGAQPFKHNNMLCKESSHNIFRLLMCRDINLHELKGVIFDFACGLDQYMLNREPLEFEFLRLLVDGGHWQVSMFSLLCFHINDIIFMIGTKETQTT